MPCARGKMSRVVGLGVIAIEHGCGWDNGKFRSVSYVKPSVGPAITCEAILRGRHMGQ